MELQTTPKVPKSILIVEDDLLTAEDLAQNLQEFGYDIAGIVTSGLEAVRTAKEHLPHLILINISLKGEIDGLQAAEQIRSCYDIPLIYLTSYADKDFLDRAKKTGPYGYLRKPVAVPELELIIETALYKHDAYARVKKSEERFTLAMEATRDGLWDWDIRTGETYFSPGYFKMLGYEPGEFPDHYETWLDLVHPEDREKALQDNMDCIENHCESFETEFRMKTKAGQWLWILGRGKAIEREESGRATRLVGTHVDISGLKKMEEALRQSQENLQTLFDTVEDLLFVIDADGLIVQVNAVAVRRLGYTRAELSDMKIADLHPHDQREELMTIIGDMFAGRAFTSPIPLVTRDGKLIPVETRVSQGKWDGRNVLFGISRDITERKRAEDALREAHDLNKKILSAPSIGISAYAPDGRCVSANEAISSMIGTKREQALEQNFREIESWKESQLMADAEEVLATGVERRREVHVESTFGRDLWLDCVFSQFISMGEPHLLLIANDISERKQAEIAVQEAREQLERRVEDRTKELLDSNKMLRDEIAKRTRAEDLLKASLMEKVVLLREIHHRVKNNLALVSSLLRLQSGKAQDDFHRQMFLEAQDRIRSMALAHEKLYQSEQLASLRAREYVESLVDHLAKSVGMIGAGVVLKKDIEDVTLSLDVAIPLGFVVTELVSNCLKHAFVNTERGLVLISLKKTEGIHYELSIRDDGTGLPLEQDLGDPQTLGLNLVKLFVSQINGEMRISRDSGTEFRIRFADVPRTERE